MRAFRPLELILSCEHGGNRVPARYRNLFSEQLLATHRGYDPGALTVARDFAAATRAPLFYSTISRLLIELTSGLRRSRTVLHLSCHSFTPRLRGVRRTTDIGLLFDPSYALEAAFCDPWRKTLQKHAPRLRVRHNHPYRGTGDALTTSLRQKFAAHPYLGIEIEINQKFPRGEQARWRALRAVLLSAFEEALENWGRTTR